MESEFLDDEALGALGREVDESYVSPLCREVGGMVRPLLNMEMEALRYWIGLTERGALFDRWRLINAGGFYEWIDCTERNGIGTETG